MNYLYNLSKTAMESMPFLFLEFDLFMLELKP